MKKSYNVFDEALGIVRNFRNSGSSARDEYYCSLCSIEKVDDAAHLALCLIDGNKASLVDCLRDLACFGKDSALSEEGWLWITFRFVLTGEQIRRWSLGYMGIAEVGRLYDEALDG